LQYGPAVRHGDVVYVHVHDASDGISFLGHFVNVASRWYAGIDVQELVK